MAVGRVLRGLWFFYWERPWQAPLVILKQEQRLSNNFCPLSLPTVVSILLLTLMSKRAERSSSSSSCAKPSPKRNKLKSDDMDSDQDSISLQQLLDKLNSMESRMEDNFSNLHSQIAQLTYEFKEDINGVKTSLKEFEKSLDSAWISIEDLQQESKALKVPLQIFVLKAVTWRGVQCTSLLYFCWLKLKANQKCHLKNAFAIHFLKNRYGISKYWHPTDS